MEDSKFFKSLWRFNAVLIAAAGMLAILVLIFSLYMIFKEINGRKRGNEIVNVDPQSNIEEVFRLGSIEHVKGSNSVIVPLLSDQFFSLKYSGSKSTVSTRNLLFSDMESESSAWLLPSNQYLIVEHRQVNESGYWDRDKDVLSILYHVVTSDTNGDNRLTENDKITLSISTPEGKNHTELAHNIDEVLGYVVLDKNVIAVMFNRDNQGLIIYINVADFSISKEIVLPGVGPQL
ncbi:MAG: hypothetical protein VYA55_06235 [Pseudomonadota bacterium]|nr:hypothetical protein [Pseudomonadota bacterium]